MEKGEWITIQVLLRSSAICICGIMFFASCMMSSNQLPEKKKPQAGFERVRAQQIIIKFKDAKIDPTQFDFLKQLSRDANATLQYLRPMSGGAHVFRVAGIADEKQLAVIIQRLYKRADIEYVEEDSIMVHQQKR